MLLVSLQSICEEAEQTCPSATADIVFLVDGSNSIGYENFQKLKLWMKNIVDAFQVKNLCNFGG